MKKVLLASAALAVLSTAALAADLPSRRAPPVYAPPPPVFSWTGLYIGGQVGYEFGSVNPFAAATATGAGLASASVRPQGIIGGGHVGYLWSTQSLPVFGGAFGTGGVIGIEGDADGSSDRAAYAFNPVLAGSIRNDIQGSIRGRLGFAVDRALFYATGGVAIGDIRTSYTAGPFFDSFSHSRVGYTFGGGVEYAFTQNTSFRIEYRYTDYGSFTDTLANTTAGGVAVRQHERDNRVQLGVSYKFDSLIPAPVVARY